jgi:transcriptional regulator with XRE-family HTH domain
MLEHSLSFAELLKQLRTAAGLTQEELAEAAGLSSRSISDLERGINRTARRETTRLLADALRLQGSARATFEMKARGRGETAYTTAGNHDLKPSVASAAGATRTLPRDTVAFTGREQELAQLAEVVEHRSGRGARVVMIHAIDGMAGIGKTTFAVHAAHQLTSRFPDGQIFLRLHGHTPGQSPVQPPDALATLLLSVGVPAQQIPADTEARAGLWRSRMAGKKALLILDDATGSDQVRLLLPGGGETLVLVTSRRRLAALTDALPITLEALEPDHAAELFVRLSDRVDVQASDGSVGTLAQLCGYLPLAISLMAGQLKHHQAWTLTDLVADLASARDRLAAIRAEDQSVRAAFDLSYADLENEQQQFFRRIGLQPGADIDAYAAAALAKGELAAAQGLLEHLYAHHLIDEPSRGRYRFHDLIREYARDLALADDPAERSAATARLLGYYLFSARTADRHLARRTSVSLPIGAANRPVCAPLLNTRAQSATWMEAERLNLQAVVDYSASGDEAQYAVAIPVAMHGFLRINGHWGQALAVHQTALAEARGAGDTLGEAAALANIGDMKYLTGDYPAATGNLTLAQKLFRGIDNQLGEANCLSTMGLVHRLTGDPTSATVSLTQALEAYRVLGDVLGEAIALSELGYAQYLTGDHQTSDLNLHAADQLLCEIGDQNGQANNLIYLSAVQQSNGDHVSAAASLSQALGIYSDTGTPWGEANALLALGNMQRLSGEPAAATSLTKALELYRNLGHLSGEAEALNSIGELLLRASLPVDAHARHAEALAIARDIAAPLQEARALEGIGRCHIQDGHASEAVPLLHQALEIYRSVSPIDAQRLQEALRQARGAWE